MIYLRQLPNPFNFTNYRISTKRVNSDFFISNGLLKESAELFLLQIRWVEKKCRNILFLSHFLILNQIKKLKKFYIICRISLFTLFFGPTLFVFESIHLWRGLLIIVPYTLESCWPIFRPRRQTILFLKETNLGKIRQNLFNGKLA